ncbi:MAG: Loki-CTERM sorting domain-containing protein, partial [Promethearchaeota archaeon]
SAAGTSTLSNDYIGGEMSYLYLRDNPGDPFLLKTPGDPDYMPEDWALCVGSWAFIMAGIDEDYSLLNSTGSEIGTQTTNHGLTTVSAVVTGEEVFNYEFEQKTDYTQYEWGNPSNSTTNPVLYDSIGIVGNEEFTDLVSGMTQLIGQFAQLMITYAINQTNHFTNGITFEDAWDFFDPSTTAALFVSCYPEFGEYKGGRLEHDPVFTAFFDIRGIWGWIKKIPGYNVFILLGSIALGASVFVLKIRKKK